MSKKGLFDQVNYLGEDGAFKNRSQASSTAVEEMVERHDNDRFADECSKLDPKHESDFADLGLEIDFGEWPEY